MRVLGYSRQGGTQRWAGRRGVCRGGVIIGRTGVRAHPPSQKARRDVPGCTACRECSGLGPCSAGGLSCCPADHTASGPEGGEAHAAVAPPGPFLSPVTRGGHCGQAGAPQPAKVRKVMALPTAPPLGPPPGRVQTAAARTSGLFHVLWVEQALGSDEYFKHFLKMMGSPAPGRVVSRNFQGDRGINFCIDPSWSLVRGGGCSEPPL